MSTKREFVQLAMQEGANRRELCRRFGISPKAGYALLKRFVIEGEDAFTKRSRRPLNSPRQTASALQLAVLDLRSQHPAWGARKIGRRLQDLGHGQVPAASTITDLLRRHGLIAPADNDIQREWLRFEHELPNGLWQMDFKGYFETAEGRCTPLTVLDDHSRFSLATLACSKTDGATVQALLQGILERYGLPARINSDNGSPWGSPSAPGNLSSLDVWMIRLGLRSTHSAPYHHRRTARSSAFTDP
jgi:transposase InsO family protein